MANLSQIAGRVATGEPLDDADRPAVAAALRKLADAEPTHLRRGRRDRILRDIAATYFAGMSVNRQANEIGKAARRYAATAWLLERGEGESHEIENPRPSGTIEHDLWRALSAYPVVPADRQMRTILSA